MSEESNHVGAQDPLSVAAETTADEDPGQPQGLASDGVTEDPTDETTPLRTDTSATPLKRSGHLEDIVEEEMPTFTAASSSRARRIGTTVPPPIANANALASGKRKISFADKEQKICFEMGSGTIHEDEPLETPTRPYGEYVEASEDGKGLTEEERERRALIYRAREARFSTASKFSFTSRPSFQGIASRPSMASLRSTLTRVNSELYPERGSFVAMSIGHSLAELPQLAKKMYIITQVLAAVSVSIGSMAVGFSAAYTSPALSSMSAPNSTLNVTEDQKSWIGSLMPLSALVGSVMGGYLVDALGRKMLILLCGPPFLAAWLVIGSAVDIWMLYAGRVLTGLCVGLLTLTLPVYLGETIQPEIRGTLGLFPTTIGNLGILLCFTLGMYLDWSWLAYAGAVIPLVFFSMMIFVPETPRWYVARGRDDHARRALEWLRGSDNDVELELDAIIENFSLTEGETNSFKDIFQKKFVKPLVLSIGLMLFQQLSGINAVIFYTVTIFEMSGSSINGHICTIIVGIVNLFSTFVANVLIDRLGRKILLYVSGTVMVTSLVMLGVYFYLKDLALPGPEVNEWDELVSKISWLPLVSFIFYIFAFSLGWGPIPWLFMGEALPAKVRGPAASLVTSFNWSCTFMITKTFPGMIQAIGASGVFFMFSAVMLASMFFTIFAIPETKGKTLEEIEALISGKPPPSALQRKFSDVSGIVIR